jgi:hypothetical protein
MLPLATHLLHSFVATGGNNITHLLTCAETCCTHLSTHLSTHSQTHCHSHNLCLNSLHLFEHTRCVNLVVVTQVACMHIMHLCRALVQHMCTLPSTAHCYSAATVKVRLSLSLDKSWDPTEATIRLMAHTPLQLLTQMASVSQTHFQRSFALPYYYKLDYPFTSRQWIYPSNQWPHKWSTSPLLPSIYPQSNQCLDCMMADYTIHSHAIDIYTNRRYFCGISWGLTEWEKLLLSHIEFHSDFYSIHHSLVSCTTSMGVSDGSIVRNHGAYSWCLSSHSRIRLACHRHGPCTRHETKFAPSRGLWYALLTPFYNPLVWILWLRTPVRTDLLWNIRNCGETLQTDPFLETGYSIGKPTCLTT